MAHRNATGEAPVARSGIGGGAGGTGEGAGAGPCGASVPGGETALRVREGAVPGTAEEHRPADDPVRPVEPLDGASHHAGWLGRSMPGSVWEASWRPRRGLQEIDGPCPDPFGRVEPPRDGSPAKFRRPLATVPDETDRDDVHSARHSALCSASLSESYSVPRTLGVLAVDYAKLCVHSQR